MGRREIKDGLEVFRSWLVKHESLSPSTAQAYTSHVRAALRTLGDEVNEADAVARYFDELHRDKPFTYNNVKRGWVLYCKWVLEEHGTEIASPGNEQSKLRNTLEPLPYEVRQAILDLLNVRALPLVKMPLIVWGDVQDSPYQTQVDVRVPGKSSEFWRVDRDLLEPLREYAQTGEFNGSIPLIPAKPGGLDPYSYRSLRRELAAARDDEDRSESAPARLACAEEDTSEPVEDSTPIPAPTAKAPGVPPGMEPGQEPAWWKNLVGVND